MNRKKSILISLTGITVVMLALLGLTYGYYITNIIGNTNSNSISIDTKDLKLVYNDGTEDLVFGAIEPGWTNSDEPKVFTVNNTGKSNIDEYAVGIDEVINTLNRTEDLVYTITCKSYKFDDYEDDGVDATESGVCRGDSGEFPKENSLILTNQIDSGYIHVYEMVISYKYLDDVNQSEDMGASIGGRIQIYTLPDTIDITGTVTGYSEGDYVEISTPTKTSQIVDGKYKLIGVEPGNHTLSIKYLDENDVVQTRSSKQISVRMGEDAGVSDNTITMNSTSGNVTINLNASSSSLGTDITGVGEHTKLLKDVIIANAIKNTNTNSTTGTIYSPIPLSVPRQQANSENERTLSIAEDDYGSSYYFRGNVIDNYVNFSGMCWRVLRIDGNGNIKLILADENNECDSSNYSTTNGVSGLINGGATYDMGILLKESAVKSFFETNLISWGISKSLDKSKLIDAEWCFVNSIKSYDTSFNEERLGMVNYGADSISLKCNSTGLFGTKALVYSEENYSYIGMLTVDEAFYAGLHNGTNPYNYLYPNVTGASQAYWTLTPDDVNYYYNIDEYMKEESIYLLDMTIYAIQSDNSINGSANITMGYGTGPFSIRPVIELKNTSSVSTKNDVSTYGEPGTYTNPYVIE